MTEARARPAPRGGRARHLPLAAAARAILLALAPLACGGEERPTITEVPVYPGARLRDEESAFQQRLLALLTERGGRVPRVRVYETAAAFGAVVAFYEGFTEARSLSVGRFVVASRLRQLAQAARTGMNPQLAVGRLLFGSEAAEPLPPGEVADSLEALAARLAGVEGLLAVARVPLATTPAATAEVTIERPHLNVAERSVDSLTVFTVVEPQPPPS